MLSLLIAGLPVGAMYGLAALGLVAVHRATGNVDLSLGAVATAAAFAYQGSSVEAGLPAPAAVGLALGVAGLLGLVGAVVGRLVGPGRPLAGAVASLAQAGVVLAACSALFGNDVRNVAPLFPDARIEVAGTVLSGHQLTLVAVATAVVAGGGLMLRCLPAGLAWRATADDRTGAVVVGLPVGRIEASSHVVAALLAGTAGILLAPLLFVDPVQLAAFFLVKPFAAAVAAGLTSLPGALGAGLVMGVAESLSVQVQGIRGLGEAVPLAVVALSLARRERRVREAPGPALDGTPSHLPGFGRIWPAVALGAGLALAGPHQGPYQATVTQLGVTTAILAATHVVMTGWAGQLSLAQPALAGIGAITAARLAAGAGMSLPLTLMAGAAAGAGAAALVGAAAARATGMRFAALTLAFSAACYGALFSWEPFAGAAEARVLAPAALGALPLGGPRFTWVVLSAAALAFAALRLLARSRAGAALIATREHAPAAVALGVPPGPTRWLAFTVTGALAGLAGALGAHQLQTVAPEQFHPLRALPLLSAAAVGGFESLWGAVVGAAFLTLAPEVLRHTVGPATPPFVAPAALLAFVVLCPGGIASVGRTRNPAHQDRGPGRLWASGRGRLGGHSAARGAQGRPRREASDAPPGREFPGATLPGGAPPDTGATLPGGAPLVVDGLVVCYGSFAALDGVTLAVQPGEVVALVGPNGAGKTTVIDAISGFARSAGGRIALTVDLGAIPPHRRAAAGVIRTFQAGGLFPRLSLRDNLTLAARWRRLPPPGPELYEVSGIASHADRPAACVPPGVARAAEVARAVSLGPKVLLLDEPAAGLNRRQSAALIALVRARAGTAAVLLVEHDQHVVALADRVVVLHEGRVLAQGPPAAALRHPDVEAAYLGETPEAVR